MKNLKRVLCLVLTVTMAIGLMVGAASATFTDASTVTHTDAVNTMTALNIINGIPNADGTTSFKPTDLVTRAQMAKMICIALNGGRDPQLGTTSYSFTDTVGNWAAGYIEYCYNLGIVSGYGNGTFGPNDSVTGLQAAKMMLIAMGYNAQIAKFNGADWAINVAVAANQKDLFNSISADLAKGLTRDNAAQLIYNGINNEMVTYTNVLGTNPDGSLTSTPRMDNLANKTILTEKYKVIKVEGIVTANEFTDGTSLAGKTTIDVTNTPGTTAFGAGAETFKVVTTGVELGKSVTLFVKQSITSPGDGLQATIVGSATVNANNKVYATKTALVNDTTKTNDVTKTLKAAGLVIENGNNVKTITQYAVTTAADATANTNLNNYLNAKGVEAQYIDNDGDGKVEVVTYLSYAFGQVGTYTTAGDGTLNVTVLGSAGASISETKANTKVSGFATLALAKDDYVKYYQVVASGMWYVEKMTGVTVDVVSTTGNKVNTATTTYEASSLASGTDISATTGAQATLDAAVTINKQAVFYLDNAGYVIYVTGVTTTAKYLMLVDSSTSYGAFSDTITAKVVLQDATTATVVVSKVDGVKVTSANITAGAAYGTTLDGQELADGAGARIFSYTVDTNGKYELTTQTTVRKAAGGAGVAAITNNVPAVSAGIVANSTVPIVVNDGTNYAAYAGIGAVPSRTNADVFAVVGTNNIAKIIFTTGGAGSTSSNNFMYVISKTATITVDSNGSNVYTYNVVRGGEITKITATSATLFPGAGLYKVTFTGNDASDQIATDAQIVDRSTVVTASNGVIANASGSYLYNDATKYFIIKGGVATAATLGDIVTTGATTDKVSFLLGTNAANNTAQYVFIERDSFVTVTAPAATATYSYSVNRATASVGDTVVLTITQTVDNTGALRVNVTPTNATYASGGTGANTNLFVVDAAAPFAAGTATITYTVGAGGNVTFAVVEAAA